MAIQAKLASIVLAGMLIAGCAAPPMQGVPTSPTPPSYAIGSNPLVAKDFSHMTRALDERNSVIYLQSFGGGGVAVGVLLGPLGVAANMSMIEKVTDGDVAVLKGKIAIDPNSLFGEVSREFPPLASAPPSSRSVLITPLINVVKQENEDLLFGCTLLVDYTASGTAWIGRYVYQLPLRYAKAAVARGLDAQQQAALVQELQTGFRTLARLYLDDAAGRLPRGGDVKFRSTFVQPRFDFELTGKQLPADGDRLNVWLGYAGIYSLPRDPGGIGSPGVTPAAAAPAPASETKTAVTAAGQPQAKVVLASFVSTPLPDDVKVSAPASGFAGVWTGKWGGDVDTTLVVEEIDGRTARVVYSWGISHRAKGGPDKPGFQRVDAQIADDGTLRLSLRNGATAIYQLSADGRSLSGQYFRNRYRADSAFERRELP